MHRYCLITGSVLTALLSSSIALAAESMAVGRWDLTVMVSADYKPPSWLEVRRENDKHVGTLVGETGGVRRIGEVKVDGDKIEFKSEDQPDPECTYTATIKNNTINGMRTTLKGKDKGKKHPFIGLKFAPAADATGEWKMKIGEADKATLTLKANGKTITGKIAGKHAGEIIKGLLEGNTLVLTLKSDDQSSQIEAKVKGDVLEGTIKPAEGKAAKFTARRDRQWGEPIKLFNGKNLDGWKTIDPPGEKADNKWTAVDGVLTNTAGGKNIVSDKTFMDFKLHVEFRVPPKGNSGVYLRGRYEVQVQDSAGKEPSAGSCGAVYGRIVPSTNAAKPAGEWQTYDITLVGQYLTVVHNGKTVIDNQELEGITGGALDSNEHAPGPIYFQGDHSKIEYRNIEITPAK